MKRIKLLASVLIVGTTALVNAQSSPSAQAYFGIGNNGVGQFPCVARYIQGIPSFETCGLSAVNNQLMFNGLPVGAGGSTTLPVAPTADYNFAQGTGTTLVDQTNNGNNGTFASSAPTWTATGLSFTGQQGVQLPSSLNNSLTFMMAVYINPIVNGGIQPSNSYPVLVSSSQSTAFGLLYKNNAGNFANLGTFTPAVTSGGSLRTQTNVLMSGFHILTYVFGSVDHLYIDGLEVNGYSVQGISAGTLTSGNLFLGSSNSSIWTGSGFNGTYYRFLTFNSALNSSQVNQISGLVLADVMKRGITTLPIPALNPGGVLIANGDSITYGLGVTTPWTSLVTLPSAISTYYFANFGVPSLWASDALASEPNRIAPICGQFNPQGPTIVLEFLGTNDITGVSPNIAFASLGKDVSTLKQAGCMVFVGTMLSRVNLDSQKNTYDSFILSNLKLLGADGVIDFAANAVLGADGANTNRTYFQNDGVHPTQAGQQLLANTATNSLAYYFGNRAANPNIVSATTYQMLSSDGFVTLSGTASQTLTLPDCTGPSGEAYIVNNPTSFVGSIVGKAGQPINGLTTAISIPANFTISIRDVPNTKSVGGCHWTL